MTWQIKTLIALALLLGGFSSGFGTRAYIAHADALAVQNKALGEQLKASADYATALDKRDAQILTLNRTLYNLDLSARKNLDDQLNKNSALRTDLAAAERMRFHGAVCTSQPTASKTPAPGVVGDDDGVALTGEARSDVLDLRASILTDKGIIDYLRHYIHQLGFDDPGSPPVTTG